MGGPQCRFCTATLMNMEKDTALYKGRCCSTNRDCINKNLQFRRNARRRSSRRARGQPKGSPRTRSRANSFYAQIPSPLFAIDKQIREAKAIGDLAKVEKLENARKVMGRRRVMERLLRYENHYSSGAEGYP